ncbi:MAG: DUF2254 domain-containing protein [Methanogenium sp.]|nr:DUF2254 domain-containing protein [Methanogenium sp.]
MGSGQDYPDNIRNRISGWFSTFHSLFLSWLKSLRKYFILFVFVCVLCFLIFSACGFSETNIDNARYMLSALVQGQAAIISIVITLTLVAVQMSASAYSPRVIDVMKKNPDLWILLTIYAFLICYGLLVLKSLDVSFLNIHVGEDIIYSRNVSSTPAIFGLSSEVLVYSVYVGGVFSLFALFPYMKKIISLLNPETIIKSLVNEIDESNIRGGDVSPFQPVFDIIHTAIAKYDLTTTRAGLNAVERQVENIIKTDVNLNYIISDEYCTYLKRCAIAAINNNDEEVVAVLANTAKNFGSFLAEKGLEDATSIVANELGNIGVISAEKGLEGAISKIAEALATVGLKSAEKGLEGATWDVAFALGNVGMKSAERRLEWTTGDVAFALGNVGMKSTENGLEEATGGVAFALGNVGMKSTENGLEEATLKIAEALGNVGGISAKAGLEEPTGDVAFALGTVGEISAEKGLEEATLSVADALGTVGGISAEKELEKATKKVADALGTVGGISAEKGLEGATLRVAFALKTVGVKSAEGGLEGATLRIAFALGTVGGISVEKGLKNATLRIAFALGTVGVKSAENGLETAISTVVILLLDLNEKVAKKDLKWVRPIVTDALEAIEKKTAGKGLGEANLIVVYALANVSQKATDDELEEAISNAAGTLLKLGTKAMSIDEEYLLKYIFAKYLAKMRIQSESIVLDAIEEYESKISENETKLFRQFIYLYEDKYNKLPGNTGNS